MVSINRIIVTHPIHGQHRQIGRYIPVIFRNNHTKSSLPQIFGIYYIYTLFFIKTKFKQTSGRGWLWGLLLICLLKFTLNEKLLAHSLQFGSKYHVYSDSLRVQNIERT